VVDASPWGIGGILLEDDKVAGYFADAITTDDIELLGVCVGDHRSHRLWKVLPRSWHCDYGAEGGQTDASSLKSAVITWLRSR